MTRLKFLKELKKKCVNETHYNNRITELLIPIKKLHELGITEISSSLRVDSILLALIDEKVRQLRRIRYATSDSRAKQECLKLTKELMTLKRQLGGGKQVQ